MFHISVNQIWKICHVMYGKSSFIPSFKLTNQSKTTSEGALGSTDRTKVLQLVDWRSAEMSKAHRWIVGKTTQL